MRDWIGLALLSVSWIVGLEYYHSPEWWMPRVEPQVTNPVKPSSDPERPPALDVETSKVAKAEWRLSFWPEACSASAVAWAVIVVAGTLLLVGPCNSMPSGIESAAATGDVPAGGPVHAVALLRRPRS